jgi:hypothetical protein
MQENYLGLKARPCLASKVASAFPQFSACSMDGVICDIIVLHTECTSRQIIRTLKVHKHEIFLNFFLPKSNPYMPLVNCRKKFRLVSFDFCQNFEVRTFTRWLSIRKTKFFLRDIQKFFFSQNLHYGPIRWALRRFFQILIFYNRNLHFK